MTTTTLQIPTTPPTMHREFTFTDIGRNSNKYWNVRYWQIEQICEVVYGRVNASTTREVKAGVDLLTITKKIQEKIKKGYQENQKHTVAAGAAIVDTDGGTVMDHPRIVKLVKEIFAMAGESIATFLTVKVESLSQASIDKARDLLKRIMAASAVQSNSSRYEIERLINDYYKTIPTKLPARMQAAQIIADFVANFQTQADRLDQLEAGIATAKATQAGATQTTALGAKLTWIDPNSETGKKITAMIMDGMVHGYRVAIRDIVEVEIPDERKAFIEWCQKNPKVKRQLLIHGTNNKNARHILRTGMKIPVAKTNGWMFGPGLYFALPAQTSKSTNYCNAPSNGRDLPGVMFIAEVATGRPYPAPTGHEYRQAPAGYDSVQGVKGKTRSFSGTLLNDEFIVYNAAQQTIRYMITFHKV